MFDRVTIYVERSAGRWEARYWHSDERRHYRFTSYDQDTAIALAVADTGYARNQCKIVVQSK